MTIQQEYQITLDLKKQISMGQIPTFVQHDEAVIYVKVLDSGKPYDFSSADRYVFSFKRKDGLLTNGLGTYDVEKGMIKYVLGTVEMEIEGNLETLLQLHIGDKRISTRPFIIRILPDLENTNPTQEGLTVLQELFLEVEDKKTLAEQATINANNAATKINEFVHKGSYSSVTSYKQSNIVAFGGVNFLALQDVPAGINPNNSSYWSVVAPQTTIRDQSWTSTGQTTFTLSNGSYAVGGGNIEVYVGGVPQIRGVNFTESSETTISFFEPIASGLPVYARWNEGTLSIINRTAVATSISTTPLFLGQIAVVGSVGYLATGISSVSDWKQITN